MTWTQNIHRHVLPNGLTVLVERRPDAPAISVVTHLKAGFFDEPDSSVGISHVLEHMFFKGTPSNPNGVLARETERLGGMLNAATAYDKTIYYTVLPAAPGNLAAAISLQGDALQNLSLEEDELAREIEVIVQEVNRKRDNPDAMASETLHELLFQKHRIRRWRIGTEQGLRAFTFHDLRRYYETRYAPQRTIVALVGDLDPDDAFALGERAYGGWHVDFSDPEAGPVETEDPVPQVRVIEGDVQRPSVFFGWRTVHDLHVDTIPLDMASAVLGRGRGSWLSGSVRAEGLASQVSSFHYTTPEVGLFEIVFKAEAQRVEDVVDRCLGLVERMRNAPPSESDMARVRSLMVTQWASRLETAEARAMLWCECEALGGYKLADEWYDKMMTVAASDLTDAVQKYLDPSLTSLVAYCPEGSQLSHLKESWPRSPSDVPAMDSIGETNFASQALVHTGDATGEISVHALNGVDVLTRVKPGTGVASLGVYFDGCRFEETKDTAGLSALMVRCALRGVVGMDARELALAGEMLGGTIHPVVGSDVIGWNITVRSQAVGDAANLLRRLAEHATFASDQVKIEAELQAQDAARERDDMFRYPFRRLLENAFPNTPYGISTLGDPATVGSFKPDPVKNWAARLKNFRPVVVVVGDAQEAQLLEAAQVFQDWTSASPVLSRDGFQWQSSRSSEVREKAQTALALAFPCPPFPDALNPAVMVTGAILSGMAGRLFERLREKKSLAYTVMAAPWLKRDVGAFVGYIATAPEREEEARDGMLSELRLLANERVADEELFRARNATAGRLQLGLQSTHVMASEMLGAWVNGDLDGLQTLPDRIRAVTAEDVLQLAEQVFNNDSWAEFVLRGGGV